MLHHVCQRHTTWPGDIHSALTSASVTKSSTETFLQLFWLTLIDEVKRTFEPESLFHCLYGPIIAYNNRNRGFKLRYQIQPQRIRNKVVQQSHVYQRDVATV